MRTCISVSFFHLFFNPSELPSIYLIRSGDGRISSSILPRLDFFSIVTKKEENGKVEGQERGHIRAEGSAGVEYAAMGSIQAREIGLSQIRVKTFVLIFIYIYISGVVLCSTSSTGVVLCSTE